MAAVALVTNPSDEFTVLIGGAAEAKLINCLLDTNKTSGVRDVRHG